MISIQLAGIAILLLIVLALFLVAHRCRLRLLQQDLDARLRGRRLEDGLSHPRARGSDGASLAAPDRPPGGLHRHHRSRDLSLSGDGAAAAAPAGFRDARVLLSSLPRSRSQHRGAEEPRESAGAPPSRFPDLRPDRESPEPAARPAGLVLRRKRRGARGKGHRRRSPGVHRRRQGRRNPRRRQGADGAVRP